MNYRYLMQHISYHLHTFVKQYEKSGQFTSSFCGRVDFSDAFSENKNLKEFLSCPVSFLFPFLFSVNQNHVYAFVPTPKFDFLIGPVRFSQTVHLKYEISKKEGKLSESLSLTAL